MHHKEITRYEKTFPNLTSDEASENFVNDADLSEYDFSEFTHVRFEFMPKDKHVNLRMPDPLLQQVKARAKEEGIPYQRYIRLAVERSLIPKPLPISLSKPISQIRLISLPKHRPHVGIARE